MTATGGRLEHEHERSGCSIWIKPGEWVSASLCIHASLRSTDIRRFQIEKSMIGLQVSDRGEVRYVKRLHPSMAVCAHVIRHPPCCCC